jgi:hypothetical protein
MRMTAMRWLGGVALALALTACGSSWNKAGVSREKAAQDYSECRHMAEIANRRDSNIDTDILASRGQDWQRLGILNAKRADYADANEARTGDIVDRCMLSKGYTLGQ